MRLVLVLLLLLLSSCSRYGPECIAPDDFGDINEGLMTIQSNTDKWQKSNITVSEEKNFTLKIFGKIDLSDEKANLRHLFRFQDLGLLKTKDDYKKYSQVNLNKTVKNGEILSLSINSEIAFFPRSFNPEENNYVAPDVNNLFYQECNDYNVNDSNNDFKCVYKNGQNVFLYITASDSDPELYIDENFKFEDYVNENGNYLYDLSAGLRNIKFEGDEGNIWILYRVPDDNEAYYIADIEIDYDKSFIIKDGQKLEMYINKFKVGYDPDSSEIIDLEEYKDKEFKQSNLEDDQFGNLFFRLVDDHDSDYTNNKGSYYADFSDKSEKANKFSGFISDVITPVKRTLLGSEFGDNAGESVTSALFKSLINGTTNFIELIRVAMLLSIILFATMFLLGLANVSLYNLIIYIIKLSIVAALLSPTSWDFFYNNFFRVFIYGTEQLSCVLSGQFADIINDASTNSSVSGDVNALLEISKYTADGCSEAGAFAFLDITMNRFFSSSVQTKLTSLFLHSFPVGAVFALLVYIGFLYFLVGVFLVVASYIASIIAIAVLITLAPIYITFMLFERTKDLFMSWWRNLLSMMLQPAILISLVAVFNLFIYSIIYIIFDYAVCWGCALNIDLPFSEILGSPINFDRFCLISGYEVWNSNSDLIHSSTHSSPSFYDGEYWENKGSGTGFLYDPVNTLISHQKMPVTIYQILIFFIFVHIFFTLIEVVSDIATVMTGGRDAPELITSAKNLQAQAKSAVQGVKNLPGAFMTSAKKKSVARNLSDKIRPKSNEDKEFEKQDVKLEDRKSLPKEIKSDKKDLDANGGDDNA